MYSPGEIGFSEDETDCPKGVRDGLKNRSGDGFQEYLTQQENFSGWDFSYLEDSGRMQSFPLTWNYYNEIKPYCQEATNLLDMGTGGGEFLASLPFLPEEVAATEGYKPNIPVARQRLEPLGITVYPLEKDEELPFAHKTFDLILNRHASYSVQEVKRILRDGAFFLTQQVGGLDGKTINLILGAGRNGLESWNGQNAQTDLIEAGFLIHKMVEMKTWNRFYDLGALLYYLQAIPWQIPDFLPVNFEESLRSLHAYMEETGYLDCTCHRFFLIAQKPVLG